MINYFLQALQIQSVCPFLGVGSAQRTRQSGCSQSGPRLAWRTRTNERFSPFRFGGRVGAIAAAVSWVAPALRASICPPSTTNAYKGVLLSFNSTCSTERQQRRKTSMRFLEWWPLRSARHTYCWEMWDEEEQIQRRQRQQRSE